MSMLTLFICFILLSWVFNLSTSSKALFRRTSTVLWTASACLWDLFRSSIFYTEIVSYFTGCKFGHFTWKKCSQTLCKADSCSWRPSHFLPDSSAKALCFSICVCWMLVVFCSRARSSSISLIFALSLAFSSSCNNRKNAKYE